MSIRDSAKLASSNNQDDSEQVKRQKKRNFEAKPNKATKAWTLEEERLLLQSRTDRVPYKHIAARLGKSDLACRLHYHQMVTAKRTPDASAGRQIVFLSSEHPPEVHRLGPSSTTPSCSSSPRSRSSISSCEISQFRDPGTSAHPTHSHQRSIPISRPRCGRLNDLPTASPYSTTAPFRRRSLARHSTDMERLNPICKEHVRDFLSSMAAGYYEDVPVSFGERESINTPTRLAKPVLSPSLSTANPDLSLHSGPTPIRTSSFSATAGCSGQTRSQPEAPEKVSVYSLLNHTRDIHL